MKQENEPIADFLEGDTQIPGQYKDKRYLPYILLIVSLFTMYRLYMTLTGQWWWNRIYHIITSLLLTVVGLLVIFEKTNHTEWLAYVLYSRWA